MNHRLDGRVPGLGGDCIFSRSGRLLQPLFRGHHILRIRGSGDQLRKQRIRIKRNRSQQLIQLIRVSERLRVRAPPAPLGASHLDTACIADIPERIPGRRHTPKGQSSPQQVPTQPVKLFDLSAWSYPSLPAHPDSYPHCPFNLRKR